MIGSTLGHYEITGRLGQGGMGEVWEARDTRLGRSVAIKILPDALARDHEASERFDREARAIAALSHPHICALFDVGVTGTTRYFVMERIEGRTLGERMQQQPFSVPDALRFAAQIAQALAAAHAKHIVHRDLKPGNVMIAGDWIKVLDFGLAKITRPPESVAIDATTQLATSPHVVLGTAPYMSPEQARGEPVDHRTDLWSFGVLLYEMVMGKRLFQAATPAEIVAAILKDRVDLAVLPPEVPPAVRGLLARLLERDREHRPATMTEVAAVLASAASGVSSAEALALSSSSKADHSIVVLPFANSSPDADNEYFSDGLTEEVISDLSKVAALRVISRTTAMRLKGTDKDLAAVARMLDVRYALEGSVRKAGQSLRITAQLVDIPRDATLWSDKYSGTLDDVFAIQERVSRAIVDALRIELSDDEDRDLVAPSAPNAYAYDAYLRARKDIWSFLPERLERAERELQHALTVVGDDAYLYVGLGLASWQYINGGVSGDRRHLEDAARYAHKIQELAPTSPYGPYLLGLIAAQSGDSVGWVRHLSRAVAIDPHDPEPRVWLGFGWSWAGFPHRARPIYDALLETDPLFDYLYWGLGFEAYFAGDYARAEQWYHRGRELTPDHPGALMVLVQVFGATGEIERMTQVVHEQAPDPFTHPLATLTHILMHALRGEHAAANALVSPELEAKVWSDFQYTHVIAQAHALLGQNDEALRWLEQAVSRGLLNYPFLSERDPLLAGLRGNAHFQDLMQRTRRRWETFEADVAAASL